MVQQEPPRAGVQAAERFEWERIINWIRWRGVITQGKSRGAVSPQTVRAVAAVWAGHADPDGSRVMPGDKRTAVLAECDVKQVKAVRAAFIAYGLLHLVRAGNRRAGHGDEYQLTKPADLHRRLTVWGPEEIRQAVEAMRDGDRNRRTGSDGPGTEQNAKQGPMDPVQTEEPESQTGSDGPAEERQTGSDGPAKQGPMDRYTNHDHPPTPTNRVAEERTDLEVPRVSGAAEDQILEDGDVSDRTRRPGESIAEWSARIRQTAPPPAAVDEDAERLRGQLRDRWEGREPRLRPMPPGHVADVVPMRRPA